MKKWIAIGNLNALGSITTSVSGWVYLGDLFGRLFIIHVSSGLIYLLAIEFNDSTMVLFLCMLVLELDFFVFFGYHV